MRTTSSSIASRMLGVALALTLSALFACSSDDVPAGPTDPVVTPPQPTPSLVDIAYCRGGEPAWLAVRDGDGAWARVQPTSAGQFATFHLAFNSSRGAVARVAQLAGGLTTLSILYGVPTDFPILSDTAFQQCSGAALRTISGTVAGLDPDDVALLSSGNSVRDIYSLHETVTRPALGDSGKRTVTSAASLSSVTSSEVVKW